MAQQDYPFNIAALEAAFQTMLFQLFKLEIAAVQAQDAAAQQAESDGDAAVKVKLARKQEDQRKIERRRQAADTIASSFAVMSTMAATASATAVVTGNLIAENNALYHVNMPNPLNHGAVSTVDSANATKAFGFLSMFGFITAAAHSSAALRDYLLDDQDKDHAKAAVNLVQYASSTYMLIAMIPAASALAVAMPYVLAVLVGVNVLYQLGKTLKNFYEAYHENDAGKSKELVKEGLKNLLLLLVNVLVMTTFILFLCPFLLAAKNGNFSAMTAVFKNPIEALMATTFMISAAAMLVKICADVRAWVKISWQDPTQALRGLWNLELELFSKKSQQGFVNKVAAVVLLAGRLLPAILKTLSLWLLILVKKAVVACKKSPAISTGSAGLFGSGVAASTRAGSRKASGQSSRAASPALLASP